MNGVVLSSYMEVRAIACIRCLWQRMCQIFLDILDVIFSYFSSHFERDFQVLDFPFVASWLSGASLSASSDSSSISSTSSLSAKKSCGVVEKM